MTGKIQRRQAHDQAIEERRNKAAQEMTDVALTSYQTRSSEDNASDESDLDEATECETPKIPQRSHRFTKLGTAAFIPRNILKSPKLVSLSARMKISPAQQSKEAWQPPKFAFLQWDSKLMPSLANKNVNEERLVVAVGSVNEMKQLGTPAYTPGTDRKSGDIISNLTINLLDSWQCKDSIVNMVFDTASNTGHVSGACISIQRDLNRALLWSACRHHVGEVILTHIFEDLQIEVSRSPDVALLTRFRKNFELLPYKSYTHLSQLDFSTYSESTRKVMENWRSDTVNTLNDKYDLKRDEYKEFEDIDPAVARSAIRAFDRHLWYSLKRWCHSQSSVPHHLTAEMMPLSIFSSAEPKEDKQALADSWWSDLRKD